MEETVRIMVRFVGGVFANVSLRLSSGVSRGPPAKPDGFILLWDQGIAHSLVSSTMFNRGFHFSLPDIRQMKRCLLSDRILDLIQYYCTAPIGEE